MGFPRILNQLLWLVVWAFIAFPVSYLMAAVYVTLNGFRACLPFLKDFIELSDKYVHLSGKASQGVVDGNELC